jgi:uroporphyrinogen-III synthase
MKEGESCCDLLKIPDHILLKEANKEIGILKSEVDELRFKLEEAGRMVEKLQHYDRIKAERDECRKQSKEYYTELQYYKMKYETNTI